jgi:hypothetical protein
MGSPGIGSRPRQAAFLSGFPGLSYQDAYYRRCAMNDLSIHTNHESVFPPSTNSLKRVHSIFDSIRSFDDLKREFLLGETWSTSSGGGLPVSSVRVTGPQSRSSTPLRLRHVKHISRRLSIRSPGARTPSSGLCPPTRMISPDLWRTPHSGTVSTLLGSRRRGRVSSSGIS